MAAARSRAPSLVKIRPMCGLADVQAPGDLGVDRTSRQQPQHRVLAFGEQLHALRLAASGRDRTAVGTASQQLRLVVGAGGGYQGLLGVVALQTFAGLAPWQFSVAAAA